ncbi:LOW QUALITY PROTEIN: circadian locomoter output cycles protein kaput [Diprion similis]|uniref:LOW QUALITY PROTEIN: circadian locomoter output cycles protein kaput n=1 Tax=Diprion similis TaxID=362088 RepID=UPI001EF94229|nr:LOW QUALITY PROTEIN: circadian locomoter output cycles protein kaput [Diprion similis]
MACFIRGGTTCHSDDTMDDDTDNKDDTKRKSRNLSEKKRRDQFNMLVNELGGMISTNATKMDKSTVLKSTISFLKNHNEIARRSRVHEIQEDWKPSFLSNEEFTHLILGALDGFIIVLSSNGRISYASQNVTSLLGHLPTDLANTSIYDIVYQDDHALLYNVLTNQTEVQDHREWSEDNQVSFTCHVKIEGLDFREEPVYEVVQFAGYFRSNVNVDFEITTMDNFIPTGHLDGVLRNDTKFVLLDYACFISQRELLIFVGTGHLQTPRLIREMYIADGAKSEFTSRHSLEWKFLFLDHRAPPIIGYLPIEVLGTSGYDYYHVDDLDKVVESHEALMQKGEGTTCYYRFLTKGQQWIWLQTRNYISYNQWNSKPEFIVCTHSVVNYIDVIKKSRRSFGNFNKSCSQDIDVPESPTNHQQPRMAASSQSGLAPSPWSSRSLKTSRSVVATPQAQCQGGPGSDTTSMSDGSPNSRHSHQGPQSLMPKTDSQSTVTTPTTVRRGNPAAQPGEMNPACLEFVDPHQGVTAIPVQPIITGSPTVPTPPAGISMLQIPEILNQHQNIVMTSTQKQMQDELHRKHEELEQLIVHQQEVLTRAYEQLLFSRYGINSSSINVGMPCPTSSCPQTTRCVSATTAVEQRPMSAPGVQGVSVFPVSIPLSVPVVPSELFVHPLVVSQVPVAAQVAPSQFGATRVTSVHQTGSLSNTTHHYQHQQHQHQQQQQQQQSNDQSSAPAPSEESTSTVSELIPFQVGQRSGMLFSHIGSPGSNQ